METSDKTVELFLSESNKIEGVYDERSLEDAMKAWNYLAKQPEMTVSVVLTTHRILMGHQPIENTYKGHFRKCAVYVGNREAMAWRAVLPAIREWCFKMNLPGVANWKELHVEYECIHPFVDGNGRTGRMFMNWHRTRNGDRVYVVKESDRAKYYQWFRN